ncbi:hypothetical protein TDB9533_01891 [Thalassocella blandensis]|nr:hypothetical protein TDB9533_01891 [Thalassocella blandensis]
MHTLSGEVLIGREVECDIQLRSIQVSRYHAKIIVAANAIFVEDLQSSNGTFVNGVPVKRRTEIGLGDQIAFDDVIFRVTSLHSGGADATEMVAKNTTSPGHLKDVTDRPAVEELIKHRDDKAVPLDLTQRKSDVKAHGAGGMTMARAPVVPPAAYERKFSAQQRAIKSEPQAGRAVNKSKPKANKVIFAGLLILVLVLALYALLIK